MSTNGSHATKKEVDGPDVKRPKLDPKFDEDDDDDSPIVAMRRSEQTTSRRCPYLDTINR